MATTVLYPSGGVKTTIGTWTHTSGTAAETVKVDGIVMSAIFTDADSSGAHDVQIPYSVSVSGKVSTITIYANATVTDGRFIVWHVGS